MQQKTFFILLDLRDLDINFTIGCNRQLVKLSWINLV